MAKDEIDNVRSKLTFGFRLYWCCTAHFEYGFFEDVGGESRRERRIKEGYDDVKTRLSPTQNCVSQSTGPLDSFSAIVRHFRVWGIFKFRDGTIKLAHNIIFCCDFLLFFRMLTFIALVIVFIYVWNVERTKISCRRPGTNYSNADVFHCWCLSAS